MKYSIISTGQLIAISTIIPVITALLVSINSLTIIYFHLPIVHIDNTNACIKVDNFENGQAFNCNDVDVVLRRYRKSQE